MKVVVAKSELAKFRRRILKAYPKERIEILWGRQISPDEFHIFIFEQVPHTATKTSVTYDRGGEIELSQIDAEDAELEQLGSIHSHPDCYDAAPSEFDYDGGVIDGEIISGIALVTKDKETGRRRVRIRFWGPLVGVTCEAV